ncbi:hypothetical protein OSB04_019661 [Centaurea solstitialis]|uniref:Reverse transcriptase/retrotransposon-derived protein RNase H-like domain-containing protein n=1 Tax=Centaurea solstitialis TaxID=347529 RepID=A0AA38TAA4_9ASTR|nr:hypothetical protein OSB04_019661 [Centaurea solstitialis]
MEMLTWCTAELQHYDIEMVVKRFLTRIQGRLRDWYMSLGEYRQMQLLQSPSPEALLHTIYAEFIGNPIEHTVRAREEFLKMKCCSFRMKDLETHYNNMSKRFYCLNGIDDTNLKHVFLNSFLPSLANEVYRTLETKNITITQTTLGELYQMKISSLQKLCNQKKFLAEFERTGKRLGSVCDDKHLQIKCKDNSSCECSRKKKSHFKKSHCSSKKAFGRRNLRKKKWKFITKDAPPIDKGHFTKDCKNRKNSQALIQALNQNEPVDISNLESPNPTISWSSQLHGRHPAKTVHSHSTPISMLKKNPPPWSETQTLAVRAIKKLADVMPPLKIPATTDKRILQTDASDEYWGAVLLVLDEHNVRRICGYKSGTFKPSEQHYHSTFKEILAVKRRIEKFQFHLIGHHFQIEMDMSSFPKMLQFKRKMLQEAQLLSWSNWFSQWQFTVKHIKDTENILPDFLSRPKSNKYGGPSSVLQHKVHPMVLSADKASSSSQNNTANQNNPPAAHEALPPEILDCIADATLTQRALPNY